MRFCLHPDVLSSLAKVATQQQVSTTTVVEAAITAYAALHLPEFSLQHFAGSLSSTEADTWLSTIQHSRQNK